jgi:hypothetical protein
MLDPLRPQLSLPLLLQSLIWTRKTTFPFNSSP